MSEKKVLIFFGVTGTSAGHYFAGGNGPYADAQVKLFEGINRGVLDHVDGTFAPGNTFEQGRYQVSNVPPVTIVSWWDYSIDQRPGSNANLIGQGFGSAEEMIDEAYRLFPGIMQRQPRPTAIFNPQR